MIPFEDFKKLLPKDKNLTDEQAMKLKGQMEGLASFMFDLWRDGTLKKIVYKEEPEKSSSKPLSEEGEKKLAEYLKKTGQLKS